MKFSIGQVIINWSTNGLNFQFPIGEHEISLTVNVTPEQNPDVTIQLKSHPMEKGGAPNAE